MDGIEGLLAQLLSSLHSDDAPSSAEKQNNTSPSPLNALLAAFLGDSNSGGNSAEKKQNEDKNDVTETAAQQESAPAGPDPSQPRDQNTGLGLDLLPVILQSLGGSSGGGIDQKKVNLLNAIRPFLSETYGPHIDRGIRMATLAKIAHSAFRGL